MGKKSKRGRTKNKTTTQGDSSGLPEAPPVGINPVRGAPTREQYCAICLQKGNFYCSICKGRSYCSEECQQKDRESHKQYCRPAPSQVEVKQADRFYAKLPKYTSRPKDALPYIPTPQIPVGTSVMCRVHGPEWMEAVVQCHWYREPSWLKGEYALYQVRLINGAYMYSDEILPSTRDNWIEIHHSNKLNPSYVKAIEDPPPEQYCACCLREGKLLCSTCKLRSYCSEKCQRKDKGHKQICEKAPLKEQVQADDFFCAGKPKQMSRPIDAFPHIPNPQIPVGTSMICKSLQGPEWIPGVVQRHWYRQHDWPKGEYALYQIRLINGKYLWASCVEESEESETFRRNTRDNWIEVHHTNSFTPSYVKAIEDPPPEVYCSRCLQIGNLLCGVCRARSYCSKECQQKDWNQHKHCCKEAPSKKEVKQADRFYAAQPKYTSQPTDACSHTSTSPPRFPVGTSVIYKKGKEWIEGVVQCHWYHEPDWPKGRYAPYQVRLINGSYIFVSSDSDDSILRNTRENWIKVHRTKVSSPGGI